MRVFLLLTILTVSNISFAQEYLIEFKEKCTTTGNKLDFNCKPDNVRFVVFSENNTWFAKIPEGVIVAEFKTLQEDENILILEAPTLFSGNRSLYIMKKNRQFYLLEVAYSDILENNEATLKQGSFIEFSK